MGKDAEPAVKRLGERIAAEPSKFEEVARPLVDLLQAHPGEESFAALVSLWENNRSALNDGPLARALVAAAGEGSNKARVIEMLVSQAEASDRSSELAKVIAKLGNDVVTPLLEHISRAKDSETTARLVNVLIDMPTDEVAPRLIKGLADARTPKSKIAILSAFSGQLLRGSRPPKLEVVLESQIKAEKDPETRQKLYLTIRNLGETEPDVGLKLIQDGLALESNDEGQAAAMRALTVMVGKSETELHPSDELKSQVRSLRQHPKEEMRKLARASDYALTHPERFRIYPFPPADF